MEGKVNNQQEPEGRACAAASLMAVKGRLCSSDELCFATKIDSC